MLGLPQHEGYPSTLFFFTRRVCKAGRVTLRQGLARGLPYLPSKHSARDNPGQLSAVMRDL